MQSSLEAPLFSPKLALRGGLRAGESAKRLTILISPEGEWLFPDSPEFLAILGDPSPDYDAVGYAVRNLGFIRFEIIDHLVIEVELHPRNVHERAVRAAQQQLLASTVRLFRLKYWDKEWRSEISSSADGIVGRLDELCAPSFLPTVSDRFRIEPRDISLLFGNSALPPLGLRLIAQKWRASFARFDLTILSLASQHQLLPRFAIVGVQSGEPVFRYLGDGHRWVGENSRVNMLGNKVAHLPDREYGAWVSEFYRSVADSGQPRYDLVTASMHYESQGSDPPRTVSYERLLLPWKTPSNEVFVTSCAKLVEKDRGANLDEDDDDSSVIK